MDAWARLLTHQGLPLVPFLWRDLQVAGAWRLHPGTPYVFLIRRQDPVMDTLLVRAAVEGPLCLVVESGRGLWSLSWLADCARRVPFGDSGVRATAARERALDGCAHRLLEGGAVALVAGDGRWQGERVRSLEEFAGRLLERCHELSLSPRVVPLHLTYSPPRLAIQPARVAVGNALSLEECRGPAGARRLTAALASDAFSGVPPEDLEVLAGLAESPGEEAEKRKEDRSLPPGFEARIQAARLERPLEVRELLRAERAYLEALQGMGATDRLARRSKELPLLTRASVQAAVTLGGALPALYGAAVNAVPLLASRILSRSSPGPGTPSPVQSRLAASLLLLVPYYAAAGALLIQALGPWRGVALLLSLPVTGAWAMVYWGLARSFFRAVWRLRRAPLRGGVAADLAALREEVEAARRPLADLFETQDADLSR